MSPCLCFPWCFILTPIVALIMQYYDYLFSFSFNHLDCMFLEDRTMSWSSLYSQCPGRSLREGIIYSIFLLPLPLCSRYSRWIPFLKTLSLFIPWLWLCCVSLARNVFPLLFFICDDVNRLSHVKSQRIKRGDTSDSYFHMVSIKKPCWLNWGTASSRNSVCGMENFLFMWIMRKQSWGLKLTMWKIWKRCFLC